MSKKIALGNALFDKYYELSNAGVANVKSYEYAFQDIIERVYPNKSWWDITNCDIFMHLFEYKDPQKTIVEIIKNLKEN